MNTTVQVASAPTGVGPVTVTGYSHIGVGTTNVEASRQFYCDLFGFEELPRPDFGFDGMWLRVGSLQLHFIAADELPAPGPGFAHFALHVPTDRFMETIESLREAGVAFFIEPRSRVDFGTTVWAAFVKDPSGNVVELTDVGPIRADAPVG